jgi:hypothetical protein
VPNRLRVFEVDGSDFWNDERHSRRQRLCEEQRLGNGGTLVVDAIRVAPQTEYPLRADDHDVMLVLLRGHIESLGPGFDAPAVVYGPAGMMGRLAPLSPDPIEMLAFEFHPPPATSPASV